MKIFWGISWQLALEQINSLRSETGITKGDTILYRSIKQIKNKFFFFENAWNALALLF